MPGPPTAIDVCRHFSLMAVPVITVTGSIKVPEHADVRAAGCSVVLLKPLTPDRLVSEVRRALGGAARVANPEWTGRGPDAFHASAQYPKSRRAAARDRGAISEWIGQRLRPRPAVRLH